MLRLGYKIEKIPESKFHVSEAASRHAAWRMASIWNSAASDLKSLCKGNDTPFFLKVVFSLLFLSILGAVSPHNVFAIEQKRGKDFAAPERVLCKMIPSDVAFS